MAISSKMELTSPEIISDTEISSSVVTVGMDSKTYTERMHKSIIKNFYLKTILDKLKILKTDNTTSRMFIKKNATLTIFVRNKLPDKKIGNKLIMEKINNKELEVDALVYLDNSIALDSIGKIKVILSVIKINNNEVVVKVLKV